MGALSSEGHLCWYMLRLGLPDTEILAHCLKRNQGIFSLYTNVDSSRVDRLLKINKEIKLITT